MTKRSGWYLSNFLVWELVIAVLASAGLIFGTEYFWGRDVIETFLEGSRQAVYGTIATLCGSLLGFILAGVSIILVFGRMERFKILKQSGHLRTVFIVYFQGIQWMAITTVFAVVALLWDTDESPAMIATYGLVTLVLISSLRLYRCVWVLKEITMVASLPSESGSDDDVDEKVA